LGGARWGSKMEFTAHNFFDGHQERGCGTNMDDISGKKRTYVDSFSKNGKVEVTDLGVS
jgi:hypothetical protein